MARGALKAVMAVLALIALFAATLAGAARPTPDRALRGNRILIIAPSESSFATLIADLRSEGFYVTFKTAKDRSLALMEHGAALYDGVVLIDYSEQAKSLTLLIALVALSMMPRFRWGRHYGMVSHWLIPAMSNGLDAHSFIDYVNAGGNLLLAGIDDASLILREVAAQSGIELDQKGAMVVDHFHHAASSKADHTLIETREVVASKAIFAKPIGQPILYQGPAHAIVNNPLAFPLLRASSTAYTRRAAGGSSASASNAPFALGKNAVLVSAIQARNNARLVIAGSASVFADLIIHEKSTTGFTGNREFTQGVLRWVFQRTGVLRIASTDHHRVNQTRSEYYRIMDDMVYSVRIEELIDEKWTPFKADDVQMEAVMLDPYLRVPFAHDNQGNFEARFRLPDVHGMYTLKLQYSRKGYSHLQTADIISVRPFRHNEYERFIPAAYPYYTAAFSMMAGVLLFSFVFLYHRDPSAKTKAQ